MNSIRLLSDRMRYMYDRETRQIANNLTTVVMLAVDFRKVHFDAVTRTLSISDDF